MLSLVTDSLELSDSGRDTLEYQGQPEGANSGKAERARVFSGEGQIEIAKFDKEARQDYVLVVPDREYRKYAEGLPIEKAFSDLSDEQHEYLRSHLTPGEQRIVRDPAYGQTVQSLINAPAPALARERTAILERANFSQLEPYDYHLSFRHQTFNAALKQRPDANQIVKEIDWVRFLFRGSRGLTIMRRTARMDKIRSDWTLCPK